MKNMIKELWHGNIVPQEDSRINSPEIKYAVSLFDHGIDSVKNVALLSGFQDPLYFSSVFKNVIGVSPTQYIGKSK